MYDTGFIVIIKIPNGDAPHWIRSAWSGLVLPFVSYTGYLDLGTDHGILTQEELRFTRRGYSVPQVEAIQILSKRDAKASRWWNDQGLPIQGMFFGFNEEEADVVNEMQAGHRRYHSHDCAFNHGDIFW